MIERLDEPGASGAAPESDAAPELETVMHVMWDRIESLEAERRSLRWTVFGLAVAVVVIGVSGIIGFASAGSKQTPGRLALTDAAGRIRARFDVDSPTGDTRLQLLDGAGHLQAMLAAGPAGPALSFYGADGRPRMRMALASESPMLEVIDTKGRRVAPIQFTAPPPPSAQQTVDPTGPVDPPPTTARRGRASRTIHARASVCEYGVLGCPRTYLR